MAVDHLGADLLEIGEVVEAMEDRVRVPARPRRRTHPVQHERVPELARAGIEHQLVGAQRPVRDAAAIQLREERLKPERVLVQDRERRVVHPVEGTDARSASL